MRIFVYGTAPWKLPKSDQPQAVRPGFLANFTRGDVPALRVRVPARRVNYLSRFAWEAGALSELAAESIMLHSERSLLAAGACKVGHWFRLSGFPRVPLAASVWKI